LAPGERSVHPVHDIKIIHFSAAGPSLGSPASAYDHFDRAKRKSSCLSSDNPESAEAISPKIGGIAPFSFFNPVLSEGL
jgi:hypothetical protein